MHDDDDDRAIVGWHLLLLLCRMVLWIPPGQTLLPNNIIRARLGRFCGGQWRELLEELILGSCVWRRGCCC
jgi:hypothetical protein